MEININIDSTIWSKIRAIASLRKQKLRELVNEILQDFIDSAKELK